MKYILLFLVMFFLLRFMYRIGLFLSSHRKHNSFDRRNKNSVSKKDIKDIESADYEDISHT